MYLRSTKIWTTALKYKKIDKVLFFIKKLCYTPFKKRKNIVVFVKKYKFACKSSNLHQLQQVFGEERALPIHLNGVEGGKASANGHVTKRICRPGRLRRPRVMPPWWRSLPHLPRKGRDSTILEINKNVSVLILSH